MVSSDEEEGTESSKSRELSKQIDSHVVVLDDNQPRTAATAPNRIAQPIVTSKPSPNNPSTDQGTSASTPPTTNTP